MLVGPGISTHPECEHYLLPFFRVVHRDQPVSETATLTENTRERGRRRTYYCPQNRNDSDLGSRLSIFSEPASYLE